MSENFYEFKAETISGDEILMEQYKGKTILVVNTASKCGFTPQYEGLEKIYREHKDLGLEILGFPCDQFGRQEPGSNEEIQSFCQVNYGVSFTMFKKIEVNGEGAHPIFKYLRKMLPGFLGDKVKWNFTKFLIDSNGNPVKRFAPKTKPEKLLNYIKPLLAK